MISLTIGFLLFVVLTLLLSALVSATPLLQGTADLILLTIIAWAMQERVKTIWLWTVIGGVLVGFVSKMPFFVVIIAYLIVAAIVIYTKQRFWKAPYLAMWAMTLVGTVIIQSVSLAVRWFEGADINVLSVFNLIILPSLVLNLLLAAPIYALVRDLANWLYPAEVIT